MRYPERRYGETGGDALPGPRQTSGRRRPRPPPSSNRKNRPTNHSSDDERPIIISSNHSHHPRSVPPAFVIAPTVDDYAVDAGGNGRSNKFKSVFFGLLVVGSILYTDSPVAASARAVYSYVADAGTGSVGIGGVGTAPAFSTSHSREMKLFGGGDGGSGSGGSGALEKFEAATAAPPMIETASDTPVLGEKRAGGRGTGRKMIHTNAHNSMHRARRNGKRRPRLAHARDPTYTYEQPPVSSEGEGDSDAVIPSMDRNLHPRERVLARPTNDAEGGDTTTDNNRDANHDGLSSHLSQADGAEAAAGRRRVLSRFVFREEYPALDAARQDVGGSGGGDGGSSSNLIMTMVGIVVGLGAAVSLAVLLFLSDRPFQAKRQRGSTSSSGTTTTNSSSRAESFVVQHRRSTSGGSSSNTSTLSGSASLESIGEEEAGDDNVADEERGRVGVGIGVDGARRRR